MRSILASLLLLSITRTFYCVSALGLPEPSCLESESYSRQTTNHICAYGKQMIGGSCYSYCSSGYEQKIGVFGDVYCKERNCPSGYSLVLGDCVKMCAGACSTVCLPWPLDDSCATTCLPAYPCGTYTLRTYDLVGSPSFCPSNYEEYIVTCMEICAYGYDAWLTDCECDIQIYYNSVADFVTTLTNSMSTAINTLVTDSLAPFIAAANIAYLESIFNEEHFDDAISLLRPYLGDIISFLRAVKSGVQSLSGRRLLWSTDSAIVLEITASGHVVLGGAGGVGFYLSADGLYLYGYAFYCTGVKSDTEISLALSVNFIEDRQDVLGSSLVLGFGADIPVEGPDGPGIDAFIVKSRSYTEGIYGFGFGIGVGWGIMPLELSVENCQTSDSLISGPTSNFLH